ncbi:MAG TPA: hypothetical protein VKB56_00220, partial [Terriglobales bacterium]|nr:hypothetical protein [Terriglobales bacterium]
KKYRTEIVANDLVLLSGRGEGGGEEGGGYNRARSASASGGGNRGGDHMDQRGPAEDFAQSTTITDEDIPF